jgi:hypothetical protein
VRKIPNPLKSEDKFLILLFFFGSYLVVRALVASDWAKKSYEQHGFWSTPYRPFEGVTGEFGYWHNFIFLIRGFVVEGIYFLESSILAFLLIFFFLFLRFVFSISVELGRKIIGNFRS